MEMKKGKRRESELTVSRFYNQNDVVFIATWRPYDRYSLSDRLVVMTSCDRYTLSAILDLRGLCIMQYKL